MANYGIQSISGMLDTGGELRSLNAQVVGSVNNLAGAVQVFLANHAGTSPEAFQLAQKTWNDGVALMNNNLDAAARELEDAAMTYVNGDRHGASLF
jgi:uncharacterized protein YukE